MFNWGIIAPGDIARKFAEALKAVPDGRLGAVASRSRERAQAFANEFGASRAYGDYQELVADPSVDAVYIASPHRFHAEQIRLALSAGKPVLCEKPITVNRAELQALVDLARTNNVFLMEALWTRCLPLYVALRERVRAGEIGALRQLRSSFGFHLPKDPHGRWFNPELAGGALLDLGVYNVSLSQYFTGSHPETIEASAEMSATGIDQAITLHMRYPDGALSQFTASFVQLRENAFTLFGTLGRIRIAPTFNGATRATIETTAGSEDLHFPHAENGFEYQIIEVQRCITADLLESPLITHADSLGTMGTMDTARAQIGLRYVFE